MTASYVLAAVLSFTNSSGQIVEVPAHGRYTDPVVCNEGWNQVRRRQSSSLTFIGISGEVCTPGLSDRVTAAPKPKAAGKVVKTPAQRAADQAEAKEILINVAAYRSNMAGQTGEQLAASTRTADYLEQRAKKLAE